MEHAFQRSERVSRQMQREATSILKDLKDPRVGFVTVTRAEVSADLRHAKIFVSILGNPAQEEETFQALVHAGGFFRTQIGRRMRLRFIPEIQFVKDTSLDHADRIFRLLDKLKAKEGKP